MIKSDSRIKVYSFNNLYDESAQNIPEVNWLVKILSKFYCSHKYITTYNEQKICYICNKLVCNHSYGEQVTYEKPEREDVATLMVVKKCCKCNLRIHTSGSTMYYLDGKACDLIREIADELKNSYNHRNGYNGFGSAWYIEFPDAVGGFLKSHTEEETKDFIRECFKDGIVKYEQSWSKK